jgi:hypothetical protein
MTVTIVDAVRPVPGGADTHLDVNVASRPVTGGVDTHLGVNVAAALDPVGGLLGVAEFPATAAGHRDLLGWLSGFGAVARAGVEGTGSSLFPAGPGPACPHKRNHASLRAAAVGDENWV